MGHIQGVAERIRERLHELGYWRHDRPDIRRFCEERGYTTQYLYGWLQGRTPSFKYVTRLAGDLGVTVEWLALGHRAGEAGALRRGEPGWPGPVDPAPGREVAAHGPPEADHARGGRGKVIDHPLARIGVLMERLSRSEAELQSTVLAWRDSEERFRKIFEDGPLGMVVFDPTTLVSLGVNQRFAEMLGYSAAELITRHVLSFIHADDMAQATASLTKALSGDMPLVARESRYVRRSGDVLWGAVTTVVVRSAAAAVLYAVEMIQDMTERRSAEERLQSLFDRVPVGLYRVTPDGQLLDVNPAFVQILGYPDRETLLATNVEELYVDVEDRRRWRATLERDGIAREFEKEIRRPDGAVIWVRDSARAVHDGTGRVVAWEGALEDITARRRAEATTRALAQIDRDLAGTLELPSTTERIVTAVLDLVHGQRSVLFQLDRPAGVMVCVAAAGAGSPAEWIGRSVPADAGIAGLAIRDREPRWSPDLLADPRITLSGGVRLQLDACGSGLGVPLTAGSEVVGALAVDDARGRVFTNEDLRLVSAFADQAALALRNARLYEDARQGRREAEVLADLAGTVDGPLDLNTMLQRTADGAKELCRSDLACVALRRRPTSEMVSTHSSGAWHDADDAYRVESGGGLGSRVLQTGRPFRTDDCGRDPGINEAGRVAAGAGEAFAEMAVPIRAGPSIEGLLVVGNRCHRPFTDHDESILLRLADRVAVAIRNVRLFEDIERRRTVAECLAAVGRLGSASSDPAGVGQRIVDSVLLLLCAKTAYLYRLEPGGNLLTLAAASAVDPPSSDAALGERKSVGRLTVRDGAPVPTGDPGTEPEGRARVEAVQFRTVLAVPLTVRGTMIGALEVGDQPGRTFSQEEIHLAEALANQAALALDNIRLRAEVRAQREGARPRARGARRRRADTQKTRTGS